MTPAAVRAWLDSGAEPGGVVSDRQPTPADRERILAALPAETADRVRACLSPLPDVAPEDVRPLPVSDDSPTDDDLSALHEIEGLLLALGATGRSLIVPPALMADPRLTPWQVVEVAALLERKALGISRMVPSEVAMRIRGARSAYDEARVREDLAALVALGALSGVAGGGYVVRWWR